MRAAHADDEAAVAAAGRVVREMAALEVRVVWLTAGAIERRQRWTGGLGYGWSCCTKHMSVALEP